MKKFLFCLLGAMPVWGLLPGKGLAQITLLQDYKNNNSAPIGVFQLINFREGGFSGLYPIPNTNGKEFWTCSDRGVNVDAANANLAACRPTYDKIYGFPNYAPKIHRIRLSGDSIQILQTITMKRPGGTTATGLLNPTGFGSTATEQVSTDTVLDCANFAAKIAAKDIWGIDAEGIVVDKNGYFWLCEEGGAAIWKLNPNGVVVSRFTPYAGLPGAQPQDIAIDSVFGYRKNNRGFEGISITPNGKIYAIIQSPILYPNQATGEGSRIHRIVEIDPATNATRMFAYLNDGIIGASGANQIRLRDWKIGDMAAVNDSVFLVLEAALRGTSDFKRVYLINIKNATPVTSGLYSGKTLEGLVDTAGLVANSIVPVKKTLFMDLLANGWSSTLEKAEGLAIINDSTIAIANDNDYGQKSPTENGVATANGILSHVYKYALQGNNKLPGFSFIGTTISQGITGNSSSSSPYLIPRNTGAQFTSIISANDSVGGYKMAGIPDGLGAFDNGNGTFTVLMNHEIGNTLGITRAHGAKGAFVSKWIINKNDLSVVSGEDLMKKVNLWNPSTSSYTEYSTANPSALTAFSRFCSADLPAVTAFYNAATGLGTQERIFMNGEESGTEGRAMAHIVTGANAGTSYELPYLGKFSWENAVTNPATGDKTVVGGMDDATPGQVYFYIGTKTNTGTDIDKAGLSNGKLYSPVVTGLPLEISGSIPAAGTAFTMADLGQVQNLTGATLQANSVAAGVTQFLRPEDGAWDPSHPEDFYFATTNAFNSPSRLWKLHFSNINDLTLGGTITAVLDGTEGQQMLDNIGIDNNGHILLLEDVGNNAHIGKVWQYNIATDLLSQVAYHDSTRFLLGGANFLTQDEESSGIIDVQSILGPGMFLVDVQAHYGIPGEIVEGGQLLAFYNPAAISVNGNTSPTSSQSPYLIPSIPNAEFTSIISANDSVGGYKMAGIPDGLGAFDNGNGTFTVLMNHEIGNTLGINRAHGAKGAFVSKWIIKKSDLSVVSGEDLMKKVNLWNPSTSSYTEYSAANPSALTAFSRFCSADLPAVTAFYNAASGLGTQERIFMNGEESGTEGRAMGHIVTGANAGVSYELPYLGKFSWENAVANPATGDKTVVAGTDDATPGQVYFYIGTKTNTGSDIEKAGLSNGKLYGPVVTGLPLEISGSIPAAGTPFTMADLGQVQNLTGATLQSNSVAAGVTQFLRPEDGAWDPSHPEDFYFATTNAFNSPSRLWKLHFSNLNDLTQGGTITAVLDGTEGQQMLDNIGIDNNGHIMLLEDVGNNAHIGKVWQYNIATDVLTKVAYHDSTRFLLGGANFLTQDEESSGIIDAQSILGPGMFLVDVQAHYGIPGEIVEGGQLLAFYNPAAINKKPTVSITSPISGNAYNAGKAVPFNVQASDADGTIIKVEFFNNGNKIGVDSAAPYTNDSLIGEAGNYILTARATDDNGSVTVSDTVKLSIAACTGKGNIIAEGYLNINGSQVADLTGNVSYPNNPTVTASLPMFEYGSDLADNYGARVRGYICAPQTGWYTFSVSGDDQVGLWLSTDDNPANKALIAYAESWTNTRDFTKFPSQKSVPVKLIKGARYYIETLHKEAVYLDHLTVAWTLPDGTTELPIPGSRLSPWGTPAGGRIAADFTTAMQATSNSFLKGLKVTATPNPSSSRFTIITRSNSETALTVVVTDVQGRVVERRQNLPANGTLQLGSQLHAGVYFVEVEQDGKKQRLKLVKQ